MMFLGMWASKISSNRRIWSSLGRVSKILKFIESIKILKLASQPALVALTQSMVNSESPTQVKKLSNTPNLQLLVVISTKIFESLSTTRWVILSSSHVQTQIHAPIIQHKNITRSNHSDVAFAPSSVGVPKETSTPCKNTNSLPCSVSVKFKWDVRSSNLHYCIYYVMSLLIELSAWKKLN